MGELFDEGGDLNIRRTAADEYRMSVSMPVDDDGLIGRECPNEMCSPAYFKVKLGTGITEGQADAFCPYCRRSGEPGDFLTKAQIQYASNLVTREAQKGVDRMIRKAFGIGPSGKKKLGSGMFSMEMTYKPARLPNPPLPVEEVLRRDVICPSCGLEHAVFGLATWCPDCGADIFLTHLESEFDAIRKSLSVVDSRRAELGRRVAARDTENALEDVVSVFEATLKAITRRHLLNVGFPAEQVADLFDRKIRNQFQNPSTAASILAEHIGVSLFDGVSDEDKAFLTSAFEKRHPITHNLGVVDRKYLERAMTGDLEGREIRLSSQEIERVTVACQSILASAYRRAFPDNRPPSLGQMTSPAA